MLAQEAWCSYLDEMSNNNLVQPYLNKAGSSVNQISFAGDLLVFTIASKSWFLDLTATRPNFEKTSGHLINKKKSMFILDKPKDGKNSKWIQETAGFSACDLPFVNLGIPIRKTVLPTAAFIPLLEKICAKLDGLKASLLSFGGKIILVKYVANSALLHLLAVARAPNKCLDMIQKRINSLLWGNPMERKHRWISSGQIMKPIDAGGLGFYSIKQIMEGLHYKLAWRYMLIYLVKFSKHEVW